MGIYLMGIDVGGTNIKCMVMEASGQVVCSYSIPTERESDYEAICRRLITSLDEAIRKNGISKDEVKAIGMGLPGTVDKKRGVTLHLAALHWDGFNPAKRLGEYYHCPYFIDNDANINALGEYVFGNHKGVESLVLITLGTGIGCGVIADGDIFEGCRNMAAELGHMTIVAEGGDVCLCGRRGHFEAYCSGSALQREALNLMQVMPDTILHQYVEENGGHYENAMAFRGYEAGDEVCGRLVKRFIYYLSVGLTNVMTLYNPQVVLIGGGLSGSGEVFLEPVNKKCQEMVLSGHSYCPVRKAALGAGAGMYGACALAARESGIWSREIIEKLPKKVL